MGYFNKNCLKLLILKLFNCIFILNIDCAQLRLIRDDASSSSSSSVASLPMSTVSVTHMPTSEQIRANIETRLGTKVYCENSTLMAAFDLGVNFQSSSDTAIKIEFLKERITKVGFLLSYVSGHYQSAKEFIVRDIEKLKSEYLNIIKDIESLKQSRTDTEQFIVLINNRIDYLNESIIKFAQEIGILKAKIEELNKKYDNFNLVVQQLGHESGITKGAVDQLDRRITSLESSPLTTFTRNTNFFKNLGVVSLIGYPLMVIANKKLLNLPGINRLSYSLESIFRNILLIHIILKSVKITGHIKIDWIKILNAIRQGNRTIVYLSPLMLSYLAILTMKVKSLKPI